MSSLPTLPPEQEPPLDYDVPEATRRRAALAAGIRHDVKQSQQTAQMALRAIADAWREVAAAIDERDAPAKIAALIADSDPPGKIAGALQSLNDIIDHSFKALDMLTLGAEAIEPRLAPVPLDQILLAVEAARTDSAKRAGMTIRSVPTSVIAHTDRALVQRCLGNLVTNAIKHCGGSRVLFGVRRRGDGCVIEVRDNGKGLSATAISMLSQRHAGDSSGRGLGLWITRSFAKALGGELTVRSRAGGGSCFALRLPGPIERMVNTPRSAVDATVHLDGQVVVVLDDDADVLAQTSILLQRRGASVIAVQNEIDFWVEVQQQTKMPNLFILDYLLGAEARIGKAATTSACLSSLRKRYRNELKVVIVTADPCHPGLADVGDTPIFEKPMTDELLAAILAAVRLDS